MYGKPGLSDANICTGTLILSEHLPAFRVESIGKTKLKVRSGEYNYSTGEFTGKNFQQNVPRASFGTLLRNAGLVRVKYPTGKSNSLYLGGKRRSA